MKYIAILGGIVVIAGGAYLLFGAGTSTTPDATSQQEISADEVFTGSFSDIATREGSFRCEVTHESDAALSSGVVFVAEDKLRGDFVSASGGLSVETHLIVRDGFSYTWTSLAPQGFRTRVTTDGGSGSAPLSEAMKVLDQSYTYTCAPWALDDSLFELPALNFIDV